MLVEATGDPDSVTRRLLDCVDHRSSPRHNDVTKLVDHFGPGGNGHCDSVCAYRSRQVFFSHSLVSCSVKCRTHRLLRPPGAALDCHFCIGIDACNYTAEVNRSLAEIDDKVVSCTAELVHLTNESLAGFMPTLRWTPVRSTDEFQCVHVRATSLADITFLFIRGCTYATNNQSFCDLRHSSFQGRRECVACDDADSCNDVPSSATRSWIAWLTTITAMLIAASTAAVNRWWWVLNKDCNF